MTVLSALQPLQLSAAKAHFPPFGLNVALINNVKEKLNPTSNSFHRTTALSALRVRRFPDTTSPPAWPALRGRDAPFACLLHLYKTAKPPQRGCTKRSKQQV